MPVAGVARVAKFYMFLGDVSADQRGDVAYLWISELEYVYTWYSEKRLVSILHLVTDQPWRLVTLLVPYGTCAVLSVISSDFLRAHLPPRHSVVRHRRQNVRGCAFTLPSHVRLPLSSLSIDKPTTHPGLLAVVPKASCAPLHPSAEQALLFLSLSHSPSPPLPSPPPCAT